MSLDVRLLRASGDVLPAWKGDRTPTWSEDDGVSLSVSVDIVEVLQFSWLRRSLLTGISGGSSLGESWKFSLNRLEVRGAPFDDATGSRLLPRSSA